MQMLAIQFIEPTVYQRAIGVIAGFMLIVITVSLLRKFHMREEHGLPWLIGGAALMLLSVFVPLLKLATRAMGAGTPTTALFAGCIFVLVVQSLVFSVSLSRLKKQIQDLTIELSLQQVKLPGCDVSEKEA
jgi:hypothetical protein